MYYINKYMLHAVNLRLSKINLDNPMNFMEIQLKKKKERGRGESYNNNNLNFLWLQVRNLLATMCDLEAVSAVWDMYLI